MGILDIFFPKFCVSCGKFGTYFCPKCAKEIQQGELVCPNCEKPSIGGTVHPLCQKKYGLDGLWSLGIYQGGIQKAVKKLKYRFVSDIAETLADLMVEYWAKFSPQFLEEIKKDQGRGWVVVPVPLHLKRQKMRGFNQSALLGKLISKKLGLEYQEVLIRTRYTKPQANLKGWDRKNNIKGACSLSFNHQPSTMNYLLIDDVWTTGSTLKECAKVLKQAGANKVWAITLAR